MEDTYGSGDTTLFDSWRGWVSSEGQRRSLDFQSKNEIVGSDLFWSLSPQSNEEGMLHRDHGLCRRRRPVSLLPTAYTATPRATRRNVTPRRDG